MINYLERNGARPCDADENSVEWMLDVTSSTENNSDTQDWSEIWEKSPECKATKSKLAQLRRKFSERADLLDGSVTVQHSTPGFDAMALQRKSTISATRLSSLTYSNPGAFYKYYWVENMQLPAASPTDPFASWLTNGAALQLHTPPAVQLHTPPVYFS